MPSKPNILISGEPGSGKSACLEKLLTGPRAPEVALFDFERKGMPFLFTEEQQKKLGLFVETDDYFKCKEEMTKIKTNDKVKIVVYDSVGAYLRIVREHSRKIKTGWDVWTNYNIEFANFMNFNKSLGKVFICIMHTEVLQMESPDGGKTSRLRAFIQGKEWEGKVEGEFLISCIAELKKNPAKPVGFDYTLRTGPSAYDNSKSPTYLKLPYSMDNDIMKILDPLYEKGLV